MFAELHKAVKKPSKAVPQTRQKTPDAKYMVSPYVKNVKSFQSHVVT